MAKLESVPPFPSNISANGIPTNFVRNVTPDGKHQIARVLKGGGANEADFEILFTGTQQVSEQFLHQLIEKEFPGLMNQP